MLSRKGILSVIGASATALLMTAAAQAGVSNATVYYSTNGSTFAATAPGGFVTTGVSGLGIGYPAGGVLELNGTTISGSGTLDILVNATDFSGKPNQLTESLSATFSQGSGTLTMISYLDTANTAYTTSAPAPGPGSTTITDLTGIWQGAAGVNGTDGPGTLILVSPPLPPGKVSNPAEPYSLTQLLEINLAPESILTLQTTGQTYATTNGNLPEPASLAMLAGGTLPLLGLRRRKVSKA
jgi:hypothetical protein